MDITKAQQQTIEKVINCIETGRPEGKYYAVSIYDDAPGGAEQVTYGKSQTTEFGQLKKLLQSYVHNKGVYAKELEPFIPLIKTGVLSKNKEFINYLKIAGRDDPIMKSCQDAIFYDLYYVPALFWARGNEFTFPLSVLVIYDSYIHSGKMPEFLMKKFPEKKPINGGDEKKWIEQYVKCRLNWLANHENKDLNKSVYRMKCFMNQINTGNWMLEQRPILVNGYYIRD